MRQPGFFSFKWQELQELFDDWGNFEALSKLGGVPAIVKGLHVDIKKGIIDDPRDRAEAFGPNTYPERKHTGFFMLMWEALQDVTLIILCVAAVISLVLGVAFPNEEEGETRATGTPPISFSLILQRKFDDSLDLFHHQVGSRAPPSWLPFSSSLR
jgi:hypothetical protein